MWGLLLSGIITVSYALSWVWFEEGSKAVLLTIPVVPAYLAVCFLVAFERRPVIARQLKFIDHIKRLGLRSTSDGFALLQKDRRLNQEMDFWFKRKVASEGRRYLTDVFHWLIWGAALGGLLLGYRLGRVAEAGPFVCMGLWLGLAIYEGNMNWRRYSALWERIAALLPQLNELELGYIEEYHVAEKKYGKKLAAFAISMIVLFLAFMAFLMVWVVRQMD